MPRKTEATSLMRELALEIFKLNGLLLEEGARSTAGTVLTGQRLRVLGVLRRAAAPLTVPQVAREIGLARQSIQRLADLLVDDGLVEFRDNPGHATSRLLALSERGEAVYASLEVRIEDSNASMANGLGQAELEQALGLLRALSANLLAKTAAQVSAMPIQHRKETR
jgi:DNA-binding MarR family transcriptional regulator